MFKILKIFSFVLLSFYVVSLAAVPAFAIGGPVIIRAATMPIRPYIQRSAYAHLALGFLAGSELANVDEAGMAKVRGTAVYIDLDDVPNLPYKVPIVKEPPIDFNIPRDQLLKLVDQKNPDGSYKYPSMRDALIKKDSSGGDILKDPMGTIVSTPYGWKKLVRRYEASPEYDGTGNAGTTMWGPSYAYINGPKDSAYKGWHTVTAVEYETSTPPPVTEKPRTLQESKSMLTSNSPEQNAPVLSAYDAEIRKMLEDPAYIPIFSDANTGLPWAPPPGILTPEEVRLANEFVQKQQAALQAQYAADVLAATARASDLSADQLEAAASSARTMADADPSNPSLRLQADDLTGRAQQARAQANKDSVIASGAASFAANATSEASAMDPAKYYGSSGSGGSGGSGGEGEGEGETDTAADVPTSAERKTLNFGPITALSGALANTYPFNLPSSIKKSYERLLGGSGEAPSFVLSLPLGQQILVDLAPLEPVAAVIRFFIGLLVVTGAFFYIFHFFRGIS